jgi:hypothetical protein
MQLVQTLDDYGKPAWITAMVLGFILWWPLGLGILAYTTWSGRMGCGWRRDFRDSEFGREMMRWRRGFPAFRSSGNRAFDEYREETLRRLEEEASEFQAFLERLRKAKDKAEFDHFMAERRGGPASTTA